MIAIANLLLLAAMQGPAPSLTGPEIVDRLVHADEERRASLAGYAGMRRYRFENKRLNKRAEVTVRVNCGSAGDKTFEVVEESGSDFVRRKVIRKMIDAEREASRRGENEQTRIIPRNYEFTFISTDVVDSRPHYVLDLRPRTDNRFLIRGRIWIDAEDFAVTRVEGVPSKNPSFWISRVEVVHRYGRVGRFWLPVSNRSHAQVKVFGPTDVEIEYFDYAPQERQGSAASGGRP